MGLGYGFRTEDLEHFHFLLWAVSGDWSCGLVLAVAFESANGIPLVGEELENQGFS